MQIAKCHKRKENILQFHLYSNNYTCTCKTTSKEQTATLRGLIVFKLSMDNATFYPF